MPPPPTLTVVMAHYDNASYLGEAVGSVLGQDWQDLALILVDDASPGDDWLNALRPFAGDRRLSVFATSRNVGHYRIKNTVIAAVGSPYIAFHDSDDVSLPGRFRRQLDVLASGRADLVGCGFECVDEQGRRIDRQLMPRYASLWMRLGKSFAIMHPTTAMRRDLLLRLGGFDGTAVVAADSDFHLRAAPLCRVRNIRRILYQHRRHPRSLTAAPETGFGSALRTDYAAAMRERERARRRVRDRALREAMSIAPPNDVPFDLRPVALDDTRPGTR